MYESERKREAKVRTKTLQRQRKKEENIRDRIGKKKNNDDST